MLPIVNWNQWKSELVMVNIGTAVVTLSLYRDETVACVVAISSYIPDHFLPVILQLNSKCYCTSYWRGSCCWLLYSVCVCVCVWGGGGGGGGGAVDCWAYYLAGLHLCHQPVDKLFFWCSACCVAASFWGWCTWWPVCCANIAESVGECPVACKTSLCGGFRMVWAEILG